MDRSICVGIADMKMNRREGVLITYALGSCVGISFYDPLIRLGALLHIMLPEAGTMDQRNVFKYADLGIKETLRKFSIFGGRKDHLVVKIAGGAKMFDIQGDSNFGNIGQRNVASVKDVFSRLGIPIRAQDTGANYARTMLLDLSTGQVEIRTFGKKEVFL